MRIRVAFVRRVILSAIACNLFMAGVAQAIPPELDVQGAYNDYLDEKRDSDAAYQDYLVKKGIYDQANSELSMADQRVRNEQANVNGASRDLADIDAKITRAENERTNLLNEIDRIAIQIGNVDSQLMTEQTTLDRHQRSRQQTQRKLDQVERRIRELDRQDNGSDWTCNWVDKGKEEHRGGHPATHADKSEADRLAKEACEAVHGTCVSRGCTQPDNQELRRLKQEKQELERDLNDLDNQIRASESRIQSLNNDRNSLVNRDLNARNDVRTYDNSLTQLARDRDRSNRALSTAENELQNAKIDASSARAYVKQVTPAYEVARATSERESAETTAALRNYERVQVNYTAALNKVLAAADADATAESEKEANERATAAAEAAGVADGEAKAREKSRGDIAGRDEADGYAQGRSQDALLATFAADYQNGTDQGRKHADMKALAEDFAIGYNAAFASMLASPPAAEVTLDATVDTSTETADAGSMLQATEIQVVSVAPPTASGPAKPALTPPTAATPTVRIPVSNKSYYDPNCTNLVLAEFEQKCRDRYDLTFQKAFGAKYDAVYKPKYVAKYNAAAEVLYRQLAVGNDKVALEKGQKLGVSHRGLLDGYGNRLADAQREQTQAGRDHLDKYLDQGALLVVRSGKVDESVGADGLLSPGEKAGVTVVVDNYGKQSTKNGGVVFDLTKSQGLANGKASALLAVPPSTRLTMKNAYIGDVTPNTAGDKVVAEGKLSVGADKVGDVAAAGVVAFPYQVESIELEKRPKIDETVKVKLVYRNKTANDLPETNLGLRIAPVFMDLVTPTAPLKVPALKAGASVEVTTSVKARYFVGENTDVQFWSDVGAAPAVTTQRFPKQVALDRTAGLLLYDAQSKPIPDSKVKVAAGSRLVLGAMLKYNSTRNSTGQISINAGQTSDPGIRITTNTTSGVNYGVWTPGRTANVQWFYYDIPANLKGKSGYVMINLKDGNTWLHLMTVYLDIQ